MGCPIIMGRRSWEALGRALPGRTNIVITRTPGYMAEGALVVSSVDEALQIAREETARTEAPYIWITGGAQLYAQTLPFLDEAVVTDLELDVAASAPEGSASCTRRRWIRLCGAGMRTAVMPSGVSARGTRAGR